MSLDRLADLYNHIEIFIWWVLGALALVGAATRPAGRRRRFLLAGLVMIAFGASDYAEARTGNKWWDPWWLLPWKAACVIALLAILVPAYLESRRARPS